MSDLLLCCDNVHFKYANEEILHNISFTIKKGDRLVVLGPNGGGKSTLLKIIAGLLDPLQGTILFNNLTRKKSKIIIGYLPQYSIYNLLIPITLLDVILLGVIQKKAILPKRFSNEEKNKAKDLLEFVGLFHKKNESFSSLSGGEKQRALLARALITNPDILLLDEPTASIDPTARFCFYELLHNLDPNITIIMTSHDVTAIDSMFDAIAVVNKILYLQQHSTINEELLTHLYGKHSHLCSIGTFVQKMTQK
ncbi:MAG: metal ABC transporter ATP-binding protein [Desulfovibrionaceae bacterium]